LAEYEHTYLQKKANKMQTLVNIMLYDDANQIFKLKRMSVVNIQCFWVLVTEKLTAALVQQQCFQNNLESCRYKKGKLFWNQELMGW